MSSACVVSVYVCDEFDSAKGRHGEPMSEEEWLAFLAECGPDETCPLCGKCLVRGIKVGGFD